MDMQARMYSASVHFSSLQLSSITKRCQEIVRKDNRSGKLIIRKLSEKAVASGSVKKRKFEAQLHTFITSNNL